jgi:hypothetical protein
MACVKSEKLRNFGRFCRFKRPHDGFSVVYIYKNGAVESGAFPGRRNRSIGPYVIQHSVQIMAVRVPWRQSISSCPIQLKNGPFEP